jgi:hypothetical protein
VIDLVTYRVGAGETLFNDSGFAASERQRVNHNLITCISSTWLELDDPYRTSKISSHPRWEWLCAVFSTFA